MATAKKLPSGSWRCLVYSHTENIRQKDGTVKKKRIYESFTCDDPTARGKRKCEQIAAEWAANKDAGVTVENITLGVAYDRYIESKNKYIVSQLQSENINGSVNAISLHLCH